VSRDKTRESFAVAFLSVIPEGNLLLPLPSHTNPKGHGLSRAIDPTRIPRL
jgi:hypothetical protein